ncbi:MAG: hypothetical protein HYZ75_05580 [Elusimicrobia bacterium]|nr:hypothetical protein [Elusimicrobiota bacterium]
MTRKAVLSLAALLCAAPAFAQVLTTLGAASEASRAAALQADPGAAKRGAGDAFDESNGSVSPPPVLVPVKSERPVSADLIVGTPGKRLLREPKNPLTSDDKAKPQKSGNGAWWGLGGAAAGAGIGFLVGGPIGAVIGAVALGLLGFLFGP